MRPITRRTVLKTAAAGTLMVLGPLGARAANNPPQIGIVGKIRIPWFDNVEKGVLKAGKELGVDATMIIPTEADAAQQVRQLKILSPKKLMSSASYRITARRWSRSSSAPRTLASKSLFTNSQARRTQIGISSSFRTSSSARPTSKPLHRRSVARENTWSMSAASR